MYSRLNLIQMDVLKELSSIGSANAATALSSLVSSKVEITVPQVNLVPLENISSLFGGMDKLLFVLDTELKGDISGRIFIFLSLEDAKGLGGMLLGKSPEEIDIREEMFLSSLKESANILGGSYISALAEMTNMTILNSTPSLAIDMVGAVLDFIFIKIAQYSEEVLFIRNSLQVHGKNLNSLIMLFPDNESLIKIFETLNVK